MVLVERDLLISLLKLTKDGSVLIECVKKDAKIASDIALKLLKKLQNEGLFYLKDDFVDADSGNRLRLAVKAVSLGADIEHVSEFLRWQEFEDISAVALERNGYLSRKNVRFKHGGRRWEIDVVGCRKPLVLCIDCKRWQRSVNPSALKKIVEAQVERARALADTLPSPSLKVECVKWNKAKFVPVIVSLMPGSFKFYDDVPVVPVLQLQNFLTQLPAYVGSVKYFTKEFSHL
ncbi:restriction endonuclease [Candidatus Bathyarchaeota archaeon]|nr:restriction endonuclease [Candidatus Bathyarchaeota archaeon]